MTKAKGPPNLPRVNDRVQLRGRPHRGAGVLVWHIEGSNWCGVRAERSGVLATPPLPRVCHLHELERLPPDRSLPVLYVPFSDSRERVRRDFTAIVFLALHAARQGWLVDGELIDPDDDPEEGQL